MTTTATLAGLSDRDLEAENSALRIALWNEMRRVGVSQDDAIAHIKSVVEGARTRARAALTLKENDDVGP